MGQIAYSKATLRLIGDDLIPDEVSSLLGVSPTSANRKGQEIVGRTGNVRVARTGMWRLEANKREPENLDEQIFELLSPLTADFEVWTGLGRRFEMSLFCGIFMDSYNDGLTLSPATLLALGQRGIKLDLDIYESK